MAFNIIDFSYCIRTDETEEGCSSGDSSHKETVDKIVNASYCDREVVKQIKQTRTAEELRSLGHKVMRDFPMTAYDIFKYIGDEQGRRQVLREKLFESDNPLLQSYAYFAMTEDEDPETIREFGYKVLEHGNPRLACFVFTSVGDREGLEKALAKIEEIHPRSAQNLRDYYHAAVAGVKRMISYVKKRGDEGGRSKERSPSVRHKNDLQGKIIG